MRGPLPASLRTDVAKIERAECAPFRCAVSSRQPATIISATAARCWFETLLLALRWPAVAAARGNVLRCGKMIELCLIRSKLHSRNRPRSNPEHAFHQPSVWGRVVRSRVLAEGRAIAAKRSTVASASTTRSRSFIRRLREVVAVPKRF